MSEASQVSTVHSYLQLLAAAEKASGAIPPSQTGARHPYGAQVAAGSEVGRRQSLPTYLPLARLPAASQRLYAVPPSDPSDIAEVVLVHVVAEDSNGMATDTRPVTDHRARRTHGLNNGVAATGTGTPNTGDAPSRRLRQSII